MSATFFDYDNDGRLDIYTGNMWSAPGQRVTSAPAFMPDATPEVRALYRRHVRGNSLLRNLGGGRFEDVTARGARRDGTLGLVVGRVRLRQRRLGRPLHRQRHADAVGRCRGRAGPRELLLAPGRRPFAAHADSGNAVRRSVAGDQPAAGARIDREPAEQRVPAERRSWRLRRGLRRARARPRSGRPVVRAAGPRSRWRRGRRGDGGAPGAAAAGLPERLRDAHGWR